MAPNLTYVPRGSVLVLGGRRIGFWGGGDTLVTSMRQRAFDYFPEEEGVTPDDVSRLVANADGRPLDVLVTHAPPASLIRHHFGEGAFVAPSSLQVHTAWEACEEPPLVCSHIHHS